jgi:hypothetical protein
VAPGGLADRPSRLTADHRAGNRTAARSPSCPSHPSHRAHRARRAHRGHRGSLRGCDSPGHPAAGPPRAACRPCRLVTAVRRAGRSSPGDQHPWNPSAYRLGHSHAFPPFQTLRHPRTFRTARLQVFERDLEVCQPYPRDRRQALAVQRHCRPCPARVTRGAKSPYQSNESVHHLELMQEPCSRSSRLEAESGCP